MDSSTKIRFNLIAYFLVILVTGLVARLYFLQVMSGEIYAQEASQIMMRTASIPAPRGNIYDRNGKLLVKSIPAPSVAVDPRIVLQNSEVIDILSEKLNMSKADIKKKLERSNITYIERVILKQDIDYGTMIYLKENAENLPGVEVIDIYLRQYLYGGLASHMLGYTGEIDEARLS